MDWNRWVPAFFWIQVALLNNQWLELVTAIPALGRYSRRRDAQRYVRNAMCRHDYDQWPEDLSFAYWHYDRLLHTWSTPIAVREFRGTGPRLIEGMLYLERRGVSSYVLRWRKDQWMILSHEYDGDAPSFAVRRFFWVHSVVDGAHYKFLLDGEVLCTRGPYALKYPYDETCPKYPAFVGPSKNLLY